jgi:hypothetical protein
LLDFSGINHACRCRGPRQPTRRTEIIRAWVSDAAAIYASGVRDNYRHRRPSAAFSAIPGPAPVPEHIPPATSALVFPRAGSPSWWIAAGGAVAVPAAPAAAWLAGARDDAIPLLIGTAVMLIAVTVLNTAAVMYQARQDTRRREIDQRGLHLERRSSSRHAASS